MVIEKERIEQILDQFTHDQGYTGEDVGGSGHLSTKLCQITKFELLTDSGRSYSYHIKFEFTISIETEFTYYPDNPPIEDYYSQTIYLDKNETIVGFSEKTHLGSNQNVDGLLFEDK